MDPIAILIFLLIFKWGTISGITLSILVMLLGVYLIRRKWPIPSAAKTAKIVGIVLIVCSLTFAGIVVATRDARSTDPAKIDARTKKEKLKQEIAKGALLDFTPYVFDPSGMNAGRPNASVHLSSVTKPTLNISYKDLADTSFYPNYILVLQMSQGTEGEGYKGLGSDGGCSDQVIRCEAIGTVAGSEVIEARMNTGKLNYIWNQGGTYFSLSFNGEVWKSDQRSLALRFYETARPVGYKELPYY